MDPSTEAHRQRDGTIVVYAGNMCQLAKNGGEHIKQIMQLAPANAVHVVLGTNPCHQVAPTVLNGVVAWAGTMRSLIRAQAIILWLIYTFASPVAAVYPVNEDSTSMKRH